MSDNKTFLISFRNAEGKIKHIPCNYSNIKECANQWTNYCDKIGFELIGIIEAEYHEDSNRNYYCPVTYPIY